MMSLMSPSTLKMIWSMPLLLISNTFFPSSMVWSGNEGDIRNAGSSRSYQIYDVLTSPTTFLQIKSCRRMSCVDAELVKSQY